MSENQELGIDAFSLDMCAYLCTAKGDPEGYKEELAYQYEQAAKGDEVAKLILQRAAEIEENFAKNSS